jgi:2-oxoisovalerate dehydrogenase E1 component alpha subunit
LREALQAGASAAFVRGSDVLVPYYRDLGLVLGVGVPPIDLLTNMFAREADLSGGRQFPNHYTARAYGVVTISSIIAAHCTHAAGIAYALTYTEDRGRVVLCTTGEGATSQGEWHEALNFSAIHKIPIVFLVENNGWAISTPQSQQMAIRDVADKAAGYGMPGMICDGTDPIATYRTMKIAMDRARSGGGPTLVEAKCFRFLSHSTDDDDRTYRDRALVAAQRAEHDPLPKFERALREAGVIDDAVLAALRADVLRQTNEATDAAEALPSPAVADMMTHVYAGAYEPWLE